MLTYRDVFRLAVMLALLGAAFAAAMRVLGEFRP